MDEKYTDDLTPPYDDDEIEHDWADEDGDDGEDCGRWYNGKLNYQCLKVGSEECDWECPIGLPRRKER